MKMPARVLLVAATAAAVTALGASSASAATSPHKTESTAGATATCHFTTWKKYVHDDSAEIDCSLSDTAYDGHPVYVEWWQDGFGHIKLWNNGGYRSTKSVSDARFNGDGSFEVAVQLVGGRCRWVEARLG